VKHDGNAGPAITFLSQPASIADVRLFRDPPSPDKEDGRFRGWAVAARRRPPAGPSGTDFAESFDAQIR
jgi:hypothetical protein